MATYRALVEYAWSGAGSPGVSQFHFRTGTPLEGDGAELTAAADALGDFFDAIDVYLAPTCTVRFDGTWVNVENDEEIRVPTWLYGQQSTGDSLPPANAIVLGWRTSSRTRSGRGRTFIGPLAEQTLAPNGQPLLTVRSGIVTAANTNLLTRFAQGEDGSFGVYSPSQGVFRDVTSFAVGPDYSVLRSRRD